MEGVFYPGVLLDRLPETITDKDVKDYINVVFSNEVFPSDTEGHVTHKIYRPQNEKCIFILLKGMKHPWSMVQVAMQLTPIGGVLPKITPDYGHNRDESGVVCKSISAGQHSLLCRKFGECENKVEPFVQKLTYKLKDAIMVPATILGNKKISLNDAKRAGRLLTYYTDTKHKGIFFQYFTWIEAAQALVCFEQLRQSKGNQKKEAEPEQTGRSFEFGIGLEGNWLNVPQLLKEKGYIPFTSLDEKILDTKYIKAITASCPKCNCRLEVLGLLASGDSYAGSCDKCIYDASANHCERAVMWEGNKFTNIVATNERKSKLKVANKKKTAVELVVSFPPISWQYKSAKHMQDVMLPLLEYDWQTKNQRFVVSKRQSAELRDSYGAGNIFASVGDTYLFVGRFLVTEFTEWFQGNFNFYQDVVIEMSSTNNAASKETRCVAGRIEKVRGMKDDHTIALHISYELPLADVAAVGISVTLIPNIKRNTFINASRVFADLIENDEQLKVTDGSQKTASSCAGKQSDRGPDTKLTDLFFGSPISTSLRNQPVNGISQLLEKLPAIELGYCERVVLNRIAIIKGDEGPEQSSMCAFLMCDRAIQDKGLVVGCAPTGQQAEQLYSRVKKVNDDNRLNLRIMMLGDKGEEDFFQPRQYQDIEDVYLHNAIMNHDDWATGSEEWMAVKQILDLECSMFMSIDERTILNQKVTEIREKILKNVHVVIGTLDAVCDERLYAFQKVSSSENRITNVFVDVASAVTQAESIPLFHLNPIRLIFTGNCNKPCIEGSNNQKLEYSSDAVQYAGLHTPIIELLSYGQLKDKSIWIILDNGSRSGKIRRK